MYGIEGLLAGRTLAERYRIDAVIGRGGMGAVYRATDQRLGREVAVKIIAVAAPGPEAHARLRARFHREARAAAALHHPNVVDVYDFGTDAALDLDYLVMELLRGEDLASRLARAGPPQPDVAVDILYQAARGLGAGHRAGLIHRDVKPGNLYLEPDESAGGFAVRVLDFGIAEIASDDRTVTHLTVAGHSPFSPAYASPEQLRGDARLSPATDVFSLGALAFHLFTGRRAFAASEPGRMAVELSAALAALRSRGSAVPPAVVPVLQRALAHRAEDRFADAARFADALAPALTTRVRTPAAERRDWGSSQPVPEAATETRSFARNDTAGTRAYQEPRAAPAASAQGLPRGVRDAPEIVAAPPHGAPPAHPGWVHRASRAVWNFTVTLLSLALLIGTWVLAAMGVYHNEPNQMYAGVLGSVALAPMTMYRVRGRRGSVRIALIASIVATAAAVFTVGPDAEPWKLLPTMFVLQLVLSAVTLLFTRRRRHPDAPPAHEAVSTYHSRV